MIDNVDIHKITYDYDFKRFYNRGYSKLKERIEKKPELIADITDFKIQDLKYKDGKGEEIKNFLRYRLINEINGGTIIDCDNMAITKEMLSVFLKKQLIPIKNASIKDNSSRVFTINESIELETDTMNSFWTLFKKFIDDYICSDLTIRYINYYGKKSAKLRDYWLLSNFDAIFSDERLNKIEYEFPGITECYTEFRKFALLTHSIGNFTLVPRGYNTKRYAITKDCWDLSLIDLQRKVDIYKWYSEHINVFLYDNYFKNYKYNAKFEELKVDLLYANHSFTNKLPKDITDYKDYLIKINNNISKRGLSIIKIINS